MNLMVKVLLKSGIRFSISFRWYAFQNFCTQISRPLAYGVRISSKASATADCIVHNISTNFMKRRRGRLETTGTRMAFTFLIAFVSRFYGCCCRIDWFSLCEKLIRIASIARPQEMYARAVHRKHKLRADPNVKNYAGLTPLTLAAHLGRKEMFQEILELANQVCSKKKSKSPLWACSTT